MQRPVWTICFVSIWFLLAPAIFFTHTSVEKAAPSIDSLSAKVQRGFNNVFKFATLEDDVVGIRTEAAAALHECEVTASTTCKTRDYKVAVLVPTKIANVSSQLARMQNYLDTTLTVVLKVSSDKYFSTGQLKTLGVDLSEIAVELRNLTDSMSCGECVPVYCSIWRSGDAIAQNMPQIRIAVDKLSQSGYIKFMDDYSNFFRSLHALPYALGLALFLFTSFWLEGGRVWCFPFCTLWLAVFVISMLVGALGCALNFFADKFPIHALNGDPSLRESLDHLQSEHPDFWHDVAGDMEVHLDMVWKSVLFVFGLAVLLGCYCTCMFVVRPYEVAEPKLPTRAPDLPFLQRDASSKSLFSRANKEGTAVREFILSLGGSSALHRGRWSSDLEPSGDVSAATNSKVIGASGSVVVDVHVAEEQEYLDSEESKDGDSSHRSYATSETVYTNNEYVGTPKCLKEKTDVSSTRGESDIEEDKLVVLSKFANADNACASPSMPKSQDGDMCDVPTIADDRELAKEGQSKEKAQSVEAFKPDKLLILSKFANADNACASPSMPQSQDEDMCDVPTIADGREAAKEGQWKETAQSVEAFTPSAAHKPDEVACSVLDEFVPKARTRSKWSMTNFKMLQASNTQTSTPELLNRNAMLGADHHVIQPCYNVADVEHTGTCYYVDDLIQPAARSLGMGAAYAQHIGMSAIRASHDVTNPAHSSGIGAIQPYRCVTNNAHNLGNGTPQSQSTWMELARNLEERACLAETPR